MKDPLQTGKTPYEVLEVDRSADREAIEAAFKQAFIRRLPVREVTWAKRELLNPVKRATWDLIMLNDEVLRELTPCPLNDESVLSPTNRAATAAAWEKQLMRRFPDAGIAHALGVVWYWWARYEEDRFAALVKAAATAGDLTGDGRLDKPRLLRLACKAGGIDCDPERHTDCPHGECPWREDCSSSVPSLEKVWHKTIGYWSMLEATRSFWDASFGLSRDDTRQLRKDFMADLEHRLLDLAQAYSALMGGDCGSQDELERIPGVGPRGAAAIRSAGLTSAGDITRAGAAHLSTLLGIGPALAQKLVDAARQYLGRRQGLPERYRLLALTLETERRTARAVSDAGVQTQRGKLCCGALILRELGGLEAVVEQIKAAMQRTESSRLQTLLDALGPYSMVATLVNSKRPAMALEAIDRLPATDRDCDEVRRLRVRALEMLADDQASLSQYQEALASWAEALRHAADSDRGATIRAKIVSTIHGRVLAIRGHRRDEAIDLLQATLGVTDEETLRLILADLLIERATKLFFSGRDRIHHAMTGGMPAKARQLFDIALQTDRSGDLDRTIEHFQSLLGTTAETGTTDSRAAAEGVALCESAIKELERAVRLGVPKASEQLEAARGILSDLRAPTWRDYVATQLAVRLTNRAVRKANRADEVEQQYGLARIEKVVRLLRAAEDDLLEAHALSPGSEYVRRNLEACRRRLTSAGQMPKPDRGPAGDQPPQPPAAPATKPAPRPAAAPSVPVPAPQPSARARVPKPPRSQTASAAVPRPTRTPAASTRPAVLQQPEADLSRATLVLGLLSLALAFLTGIPAIICGHLSLNRLGQSKPQDTRARRTRTLVGLVVAYITTIGFALFVLSRIAGWI